MAEIPFYATRMGRQFYESSPGSRGESQAGTDPVGRVPHVSWLLRGQGTAGSAQGHYNARWTLSSETQGEKP